MSTGSALASFQRLERQVMNNDAFVIAVVFTILMFYRGAAVHTACCCCCAVHHQPSCQHLQQQQQQPFAAFIFNTTCALHRMPSRQQLAGGQPQQALGGAVLPGLQPLLDWLGAVHTGALPALRGEPAARGRQ